MKAKPFEVNNIPTIRIKNTDELEGLKLIDVRRPDEFIGELGHISTAQLITLGPDLEKFLRTENKLTPIVFICRSGVRSAQATLNAKEIGFTQVFNMEGGMIYWNKMGFKAEYE